MRKVLAVIAAILVSLPVLAGSRNVVITKAGAKEGPGRDNAPAIQKALQQRVDHGVFGYMVFH